MEKETTEFDVSMRVIALQDLWDIFIHRLWVIVLAAVLVTGAYVAFDKITYVPEYESTATLYILRENEGESAYRSSDDFSLALKVVNDCEHLLKSHSVLDEVIALQNLDLTYYDLYDKVSATNPTDTRILEVTVKSDSPYNAKRIVDNICNVGTVKIEQAMGFQQVNLYEYGIIDNEPCNKTSITTYLVLAVIVMVLTYSVFLLKFLLDDRIRTEEDIERYLGLSILGDIPNMNDTKNKKNKGYYRAYGNSKKERG
jgi:capsular polysaccharide biosynthesis protein